MSIHKGWSIIILLFSSKTGARSALVWAELGSFWGRVVSLLRRCLNPSHFVDWCFQVLCQLMNAAHCTWKDLHSLQIHAANIEWITSEPFIVCWVPPQFSCSSGPAQHSTGPQLSCSTGSTRSSSAATGCILIHQILIHQTLQGGTQCVPTVQQCCVHSNVRQKLSKRLGRSGVGWEYKHTATKGDIFWTQPEQDVFHPPRTCTVVCWILKLH